MTDERVALKEMQDRAHGQKEKVMDDNDDDIIIIE